MTEMAPSAGDFGRLDDLPSLGSWCNEHQLNIESASFLNQFLFHLGETVILHGQKYWEFGERSDWEDFSGIYADDWTKVMAELGDSHEGFELRKAGEDLLSFNVDREDCVFVRPTNRLLEKFGLSLEIYDSVIRLDAAMSDQPDLWARLADVVTPAEIYALELWFSRGGQLRNEESLKTFLEVYNGTASSTGT